MFILFLPLSLTVRMNGEGDTSLCLRLLGIPLLRLPKPEHPVRLRDYSPRAMKRREEKQARKAAKKKPRASYQSTAFAKETTLSEKISFVTDVVREIFVRTLSHARVRIIRLAVTVASPDAAQTALLYGAVSAAVAFLLESLEQFSHLKVASGAPVGVQADFTGEHCSVDLYLRFRLRIVHLIDVALKTLFHTASRKSKHHT